MGEEVDYIAQEVQDLFEALQVPSNEELRVEDSFPYFIEESVSEGKKMPSTMTIEEPISWFYGRQL